MYTTYSIFFGYVHIMYFFFYIEIGQKIYKMIHNHNRKKRPTHSQHENLIGIWGRSWVHKVPNCRTILAHNQKYYWKLPFRIPFLYCVCILMLNTYTYRNVKLEKCMYILFLDNLWWMIYFSLNRGCDLCEKNCGIFMKKNPYSVEVLFPIFQNAIC